jgi:hypothetical protein
MDSINEDIKKVREAMDNNKLVVFVGAGVSANSNLPSWSELIKEICKSLGIDCNKQMNAEDFMRIAQYYYNQRGMKEYYDTIFQKFDVKIQPNLLHQYILKMSPQHIITTNYDDLIEQAINKSILFYDVVCEDNDLPYTPNGRLLLKMHGDFKKRNIVLKEDDYLSYSKNFKLMETFIRALFVNHLVLFIGYSVNDYNLKLIIKSVKDVLGENFQKAYFIDADEKAKSEVELNYFQNLGVNIIHKTNIPVKYQGIDYSDLNSEKGKNIARIIETIIEYENEFANSIDYYYEKLSVFKNVESIRISDLADSLGINGQYTITKNKEIKVININQNEKISLLVDNLNEFSEKLKKSNNIKDEYIRDNEGKYNFINDTFLKNHILSIKISSSVEEKDFKIFKFEQKVATPKLEIIDNIIKCKYDIIELLAKQSYKSVNMHQNRYFNELIKAYANYLMNQYVSAYEILRKTSQEAYKDREYIVFFISEFNKAQLIKLLKQWHFSKITEVVYVDHIKQLIEEDNESTVNLNDIYYQLPKSTREKIKFIKDTLLDDGFIYTRLTVVRELREKVEKQITTRFFGNPMEHSILELQSEVYEFWEYTHNNFLMINHYTEFQKYYYHYIHALFSTYSKEKYKNSEDDDWDLFKGLPLQIMPNYKFNLTDISIICQYMDVEDLENILKCYEIDKIEVSDGNDAEFLVANLYTSFLNIEHNNIIVAKKLSCLLIFISRVKLSRGSVHTILAFLNNSLDVKPSDDEIYRAIAGFVYHQNKFNNISVGDINCLINSFLKKVINTQFNNKNGGFEIEALQRCNYIKALICNMKDDEILKIETSDLDEIVTSMKSGELKKYYKTVTKKIFIPLYRYVDNLIKKELRQIINYSLKQEFDSSIYTEACLGGLIKPQIIYEDNLWSEADKLVSLKSHNIVSEGPLANITNLLYNNKIKRMEKLKDYIGYVDLYDMLVLEDNFDFENKFNLNWLMLLNEKYLTKLASSPTVKEIIKEKIKEKMINGDLDKNLIQIYFKYFNC